MIKVHAVSFLERCVITSYSIHYTKLYDDVTQKSGKTLHFIVLSQEQAKQSYKNKDKLYLSDAEVLMFDNVNHNLQVVSEKTNNRVWMYPSSSIAGVDTKKDGLFDKFVVVFEKQDIPFVYEQTQDSYNFV